MEYRQRNRLRDQLRRRGPLAFTATALWLSWAALSFALYHLEHGLLIALLLLGLLVLMSGAYSLLWLRRDMRRERQRERKQIQDLAWLSANIQPRLPLPPYVGGMARPELLCTIRQLIHEERPQRVLELGSGLSTLVMAYALADNRQGEIFALEDQASYAAQTRHLLAEHLLTEHAHVLDAPLRQWEVNGRQRQWYCLSNLPVDDPFDFILVDGPAGYLAPMIRYPALPLLHSHFAENAIILLDDVRRQQEKQIAQRWLAETPGLQRDERFADASFAVFRYTRTHNGSSA